MPTHSIPVVCRCVQALKPGSTTQLDINTLEAVAGDAPTATLARDTVVGQPLVRAGRSCACRLAGAHGGTGRGEHIMAGARALGTSEGGRIDWMVM